MCTYTYRGALESPVHTPPRVYLEWLPALVVLSEPQGVTERTAYNYFYELVTMTCNHDIAYLVRNACNANARVQSGTTLGTPVRTPRGYSNTQQKDMHVAKHVTSNTCTRDEQVCCAAAKTCMKTIVLAQLTNVYATHSKWTHCEYIQLEQYCAC